MSADIVQAQYEQLEQLAARFAAAAETQQALLQRVNQRVDVLRQGGWQGKGVAAFLREMDGEVGPAVGRLVDALIRARTVVSEIAITIKQAEIDAASLFHHMPQDSDSAEDGTSFIFPIPLIPNNISWIWGTRAAELQRDWNGWTEAERLSFLQEQHRLLTERYGLPPVKVSIADLPDQKLWFIQTGDARGVYKGEIEGIVVDVDNLKSNNGLQNLDTLFHETRHYIQWEMVERYANGAVTFPDGIDLEQVKSWHSNMQNYILPDDDFEGYWKQPIEEDARDFAEDQTNTQFKHRRQPLDAATI